MKRIVTTAMVCTLVILIALVWASYSGSPSDVKHETSRWAVIEDINGDRIAVEPTEDDVWLELVGMNQSGGRMWVGGIVEKYNNKWGFRFKPDSMTVAEVTAEGLQATIEFISSDIAYWERLGWAYVSSEVVEVHSQT